MGVGLAVGAGVAAAGAGASYAANRGAGTITKQELPGYAQRAGSLYGKFGVPILQGRPSIAQARQEQAAMDQSLAESRNQRLQALQAVASGRAGVTSARAGSLALQAAPLIAQNVANSFMGRANERLGVAGTALNYATKGKMAESSQTPSTVTGIANSLGTSEGAYNQAYNDRYSQAYKVAQGNKQLTTNMQDVYVPGGSNAGGRRP